MIIKLIMVASSISVFIYAGETSKYAEEIDKKGESYVYQQNDLPTPTVSAYVSADQDLDLEVREEVYDEMSLYDIASELSNTRDQHYDAYKKLYTDTFRKYLAFYPQESGLHEFTTLNPVNEIESYSVEPCEHRGALLDKLKKATVLIRRDKPDKPYLLAFPLLDINKKHDLRVRAARSEQEIDGELSILAADITQFRQVRRKTFKKRVRLACVLTTGACALAVNSYLLYYAIQDHKDFNYFATETFINLALHAGAFISLKYVANRFVIGPRIQCDQQEVDKRISTYTPAAFNIEPAVICLVRDYAHYRLKEELTAIKRRKCSGRLYCRPLFGRLLDCFRHRLDTKRFIPRRIHNLLKEHHDKLIKVLAGQPQEPSECPSRSAHLINNAYNNVLATIDELNPDNVESIIEQSELGPFRPRHIEALKASVDATKKTLARCIPTEVYTQLKK